MRIKDFMGNCVGVIIYSVTLIVDCENIWYNGISQFIVYKYKGVKK